MEHAKILVSIDQGEYFKKEGWHMEEIEKTKKLRAEAKIGRETLVMNYEPIGMVENGEKTQAGSTAADPWYF